MNGMNLSRIIVGNISSVFIKLRQKGAEGIDMGQINTA